MISFKGFKGVLKKKNGWGGLGLGVLGVKVS